MPNAKDANTHGAPETMLVVGNAGAGKTTQVWTLPGRKFAYIFDPNALRSLQGMDLEYAEFLVSLEEVDFGLKAFNRDARPSDTSKKNVEPTVYQDWGDDINERFDKDFFKDFDWVIFDGLTMMVKAMMDRQLWINKRYGGIEDQADYRIVGSKLSNIFRSITSLGCNLYVTGHLQSYQDEKTKKIEVQLNLPGSARIMLPMMFSNIWLAYATDEGGKAAYKIRTVPDERGLKTIRSSLRGLALEEDVTIKDWSRPEEFGIGALLKKAKSV